MAVPYPVPHHAPKACAIPVPNFSEGVWHSYGVAGHLLKWYTAI